MMQLSVGKKSQLRTFMRMLKKIKGVNVTMLSQAGKEMTMRINYKGTETDDLLMALDDAFYSNRKFQGYALEFDQMGNNLHLKIVTDE